jgi:beta-lactamase superfamily II metal-dependent hydrolase
MPSKSWKDTLSTFVWVFDIGRGLCIFIRTALNQGIIYDFGSSQDFSPTEFLAKHIIPHLTKYKKSNIAQAIISHPHLDHLSEIEKLGSDLFNPSLLTCPHDKSPHDESPHDESDESIPDERIDWSRVNNPGGSDKIIHVYRDLYSKRMLPLQTIQYDSEISVPNLEYGIYYIRPPVLQELFPKDDQEYTNGTSLVLFLRHGRHTILIPGDIPPKAMEHLLDEKSGSEKRYTIFDRTWTGQHPNWNRKTEDQPSLKWCLKEYGLSILIAPHHGLESAYSEALYSSIKGGRPKLVVVSEKRHLSPTDGKVDERYYSEQGAEGLNVNIKGKNEKRYCLSTRNDNHILIVFEGTRGAPRVYSEEDPKQLLNKC